MNDAKKKDWAKNAIIVFLIIMLLLTFFSNTITNYTLPRVTEKYMMEGYITSGIRKSGTVEAGEIYTVKAEESRMITSVAVEKEMHVNKGDPIYYLEDMESDELLKAEDELATAEMNCYKSRLEAALSNSESGAVNGTIDSYVARMTQISGEIEAAQAEVDKAQAVLDNANLGSKTETARQADSTTAYEIEKIYADQAKTDEQAAFSAAKDKMTKELTTELENLKARLTVANSDSVTKLARIKNALISINDARVIEGITISPDITNDMIRTDSEPTSTEGGETPKSDNGTTIYALKIYFNAFNNVLCNNEKFTALLNEAAAAISDYDNSLTSTSEIAAINGRIDEVNRALADIQASTYNGSDSYKNAIARYDAAMANIKRTEDANKKSTAQFDALVTASTSYVNEAKARLEELKAEKTMLLNAFGKSLEADKYDAEVARKRDAVDKLRAKSVGASVNAPVSGVVKTLTCVAGEKMEKDKDICTIIPDGKNLQVKISVDTNEAKNLRLGDPAVLEDSWNYPDASVTLSSMKDDPENPGKKMNLTFTIDATNIKIGQNLTLAMGVTTKKYDNVIPKSAFRHDSKGDFVWVVKDHSNALRNKYTVERVDVKKEAEDEKNVAVTGTGGVNVVITSTGDLENGKQVRMNDSVGE